MQKLLTAIQTKEILNVSTPTLYRLHDQNILRAVEIARRGRKRILRWRPEVIEKFVAERGQK